MTELAEYREAELVLPVDLSFEDWAELGVSLNRIGQGVMWWLGDWYRHGERAYGEAAAQAAPTGFAVKTLQNAAWCAERIPPSRRRVDVTFGHHSTVAALPPAEADALLEEAATEQLSVTTLRERARNIRGEEPKSKKEKDELTAHLVAITEEVLSQLKQLAEEMMADGAPGWGIRLRDILEPMWPAEES
jgi:hypothetical protein